MPGDSGQFSSDMHYDAAARAQIAGLIDTWSAKLREAHEEMGKIILGEEENINQLLIAMVAGGNVLAEGIPGSGKTTLVKNISKIMGLDWERVQFNSELLPSGIIGYEKEDKNAESGVTFVKGRLFTQFFMADEINRAPFRTHSALLEAMEERQVTLPAVGHTYVLPRPFFVMATQNHVESDVSTNELQHAQLDRFLFKIQFGYPKTASLEKEIIALNSGTKADVPEIFRRVAQGEKLTHAPDIDKENNLRTIISADELIAVQSLARIIPVPDDVRSAVVDIVRRARPGEEGALESINRYLELGPGLRASLAFERAAKARALVHGRYSVTIEDIKAVAEPVLSHRMELNQRALTNKVKPGALIAELVAGI